MASRLLHTHSFQLLLPFQYTIFKLDQKDCPVWPDLRPRIVRTRLTRESCAITDAFDNTRNECGAAQLVHLLGHGDILIRERRIVNDHVLARAGSRLFERVGGSGEE
jgi:hypothetical protein